jgi:hypothetical protein
VPAAAVAALVRPGAGPELEPWQQLAEDFLLVGSPSAAAAVAFAAADAVAAEPDPCPSAAPVVASAAVGSWHPCRP